MVNSYFVAVDFIGQKFQLEVDAHSEKHAKTMVKELIKFEKIKKCQKGTLKAYIDSQIEEVKPKELSIYDKIKQFFKRKTQTK